MNQKNLIIAGAMLVALMATVVTLAPQAFAQVDNEGIDTDDDTTNISSTPTKVKSDANCNLSGWANECDNESDAEIDIEEEDGHMAAAGG
jgi:hypothetical protein